VERVKQDAFDKWDGIECATMFILYRGERRLLKLQYQAKMIPVVLDPLVDEMSHELAAMLGLFGGKSGQTLMSGELP
jgi:hypothetical protein